MLLQPTIHLDFYEFLKRYNCLQTHHPFGLDITAIADWALKANFHSIPAPPAESERAIALMSRTQELTTDEMLGFVVIIGKDRLRLVSGAHTLPRPDPSLFLLAGVDCIAKQSLFGGKDGRGGDGAVVVVGRGE